MPWVTEIPPSFLRTLTDGSVITPFLVPRQHFSITETFPAFLRILMNCGKYTIPLYLRNIRAFIISILKVINMTDM